MPIADIWHALKWFLLWWLFILRLKRTKIVLQCNKRTAKQASQLMGLKKKR